ncbi:MAG: sugar phosphate isomerase/epimerase [Candidatus Hydrogenedentes bacterium]|nr:sugar phosphate isomerase/epimerase [Candidatus Hydrogenedentota bacterium]
MHLSRRRFLEVAAGSAAAATWAGRGAWAQATKPAIRLSACDWSLQAGGPEGLETAKRVGLQGLEISTGDAAEVLAVGDPAVRARYKEMRDQTGIVVSSVAMGLLNEYPLATDPRGPAWLEQTIAGAADLDAKVILLAFFGKGDLLKGREWNEDAVAAVVDRVKAAAPKAAEAGVVLGLENWLSGEDNLRLLDRINHDAVRIYYDVGNSTTRGYDVPAEIRALGDRICQIHFKDGGHYLGEGKVAMEPVAEAIAAIGYKGWVVLETAIPSGDRDADFVRNRAFSEKLLGLA